MAILPGAGVIPINPPIVGRWNLDSYPSIIEYAGRRYERQDVWAFPEPGVVAQYREMMCMNSRHMKVLADGRFVINHIDSANPACGPEYAVKHAVSDLDWKPLIQASVVGAIIFLVAKALSA
jgi:hypothetical protein